MMGSPQCPTTFDDDPPLTLENLFSLLTKSEIAEVFRLSPQMKSARKADQLKVLHADFAEPRRFAEWHAETLPGG